MPETEDQRRISRNEDEIKETREWFAAEFKAIHAKLDAQNEMIHELKSKQFADDLIASEKLSSIREKMCPAPGACMQLTPRIEKLESSFQEIHDILQQGRGVARSAYAFWAVAGGVIVYLVEKVIQ